METAVESFQIKEDSQIEKQEIQDLSMDSNGNIGEQSIKICTLITQTKEQTNWKEWLKL